MAGINPNSAFVRVMFDLPTPVALQMEGTVKASGKTKKQWLADVITSAVSAQQTDAATTQISGRRKRK